MRIWKQILVPKAALDRWLERAGIDEGSDDSEPG